MPANPHRPGRPPKPGTARTTVLLTLPAALKQAAVETAREESRPDHALFLDGVKHELRRRGKLPKKGKP